MVKKVNLQQLKQERKLGRHRGRVLLPIFQKEGDLPRHAAPFALAQAVSLRANASLRKAAEAGLH